MALAITNIDSFPPLAAGRQGLAETRRRNVDEPLFLQQIPEPVKRGTAAFSFEMQTTRLDFLKMKRSVFLFTVFSGVLALTGCGEKPTSSVPAVPGSGAPAAAPASTSGGNLARIQSAKILKIGVRADSPPFGFADAEGNPRGFDVELGFRIARALDAQPLFITVTSGDRIEKLKKGEVDILLATLTGTRRRAKEIDFSMPYFQDQQMLLVKSASPILSYRDLAGKKVAALNGSTSFDNIKKVAPDSTPVGFGTGKEAIEALLKGEVDALTGDGLTMRSIKLAAENPDSLRIAGEGFSVEPFVIGLPRNDSEFRGKIDDVLTGLWNDGTWTRLFNKWLGAESAYNLQSEFKMQVLPE